MVNFPSSKRKNQLDASTTKNVVRVVLVVSSTIALYSMLIKKGEPYALDISSIFTLQTQQQQQQLLQQQQHKATSAQMATQSPRQLQNQNSNHNLEHNRNPALELVQRATVTRPKRFCPCCGWTGDAFERRKLINSGGGPTTNATVEYPERGCPACGALERHRKVCAMISCEATTPLTRIFPDQPFRLIHFGPEKAMMNLFNQFQPSIDQVGVDMRAMGYDVSYDVEKTLYADVTNLQFPSGFANGIIILHVMEHVRELQKAANELMRVLAPGGWIIMEVPCGSKEGQETRDCRQYTTGPDLTKCAGQYDHVWWFTCDDFANKMKDYGLQCEKRYNLDNESQCLDQSLRTSILPSNVAIRIPILFCRKPS